MKKNVYLITAGLLMFAASGARAQMKIGSPGAPDPSAMLEVTGGPSNNKGLLVPRISLTDVNTWGLSGSTPVAGMVVYNTNASATGGSGVGLYFWMGTQWVKAANTADWSLNGNSGTNPATNFIGTADNQPLVLRTNNAEAMRVAADGNVGIGTTAPNSSLSITPNADGAKITLWDGGSDSTHYGFGITGTYLNYHVIDSSATHRFFAGGKNGNGTELMRVQGNGNVGIGVTAPTAQLHLSGAARIEGSAGTPTSITGRDAAGNVGNVALGAGLTMVGGVLSAPASAAGWGLNGNAGTNPATNFIGTSDNQDLVLRTNNTERIRVVADGSVGIGTGLPHSHLDLGPVNGALPTDSIGKKLAVYNTAAGNDFYGLGVSTGLLQLHAASQPNEAPGMVMNSVGNVGIGTTAPNSSLSITPSQDGAKITLWDGGIDSTHYGFGITGTFLNYHVVNTTAAHRFFAGGKNGNGTELMRIQGNGNVGIGVTAPTAQLHLSGAARIEGSVGTPTSITGRDAAGNVGNVALGAGLTMVGGVLSAPASAAGWGLNGNAGTNPATNFIGTSDNQDLVLRTNNAERMRVDTNGRVGIGTTAPNSSLSITPSQDGAKITLWDGGIDTAHYGFGITGTFLNYHVLNSTAAHRFFAGGKNGNGTELMRVQGNGSVGIGTGLPHSRLDLGPTNGALPTDSAGKKLAVYNTAAGNDFYGLGVSTGLLQLHASSQPNEAPGMVMNSIGNVGIGTTAPNSSLSITPSQDGAKITLWDGGIDSTHYGFGITGTFLNYHVVNSTAAHRFFAGGKNGNGTELMRIQGNGNVGIGTTTPGQKLDVNGAARISGSAGTPDALMGRDAGGNVGAVTLGAGLSMAGGVLTASAAASGWGLNGNAGTNPATNFIGTSDNQPLVLRTNNTERMRVVADGSVGIGTGLPHSRLDLGNSTGTLPADSIGKKLAVYNTAAGNDFYGLGVSTGLLQLHAASQPNEAPGMVMNSLGNVGIGTTAPNTSLSITPTQDGAKITLWDGGTDTAHYGFGITGTYLNYHVLNSTASHRFFAGGKNGNGTELMRIQGDGNVGIGTNAPTAKLSVNGAANNTTGTWGIFSDARIKNVDSDFKDGLATVLKIHPVKFHYKDNAPFKTQEQQIGIIAQEVEQIAPYMVTKTEGAGLKDLRQYNSQALPYLLVNAIQEQQAQIEELKIQNSKFKNENEALSAEVKELKDKEAGYAELAARIKQMEQMLGVKENINGSNMARK